MKKPKPVVEKTCRDCRYYDDGRCKRFPKILVPLGTSRVWSFPPADEPCGEFNPIVELEKPIESGRKDSNIIWIMRYTPSDDGFALPAPIGWTDDSYLANEWLKARGKDHASIGITRLFRITSTDTKEPPAQ